MARLSPAKQNWPRWRRSRRHQHQPRPKVNETGAFVVTGYVEREMIAVAELKDDMLMLAGTVRFGLANRDLWQRLYRLRDGPEARPE